MIATDAKTMSDKAALAYAPVTQRASDADADGVHRYSAAEDAQVYGTSLPPAVYNCGIGAARKRFFHAVVIGVLVWLAAGTVVRRLVGRESGHMYKSRPHGAAADQLGFELTECLEKPDWSLGASPEFILAQYSESDSNANDAIPAVDAPAFEPPYHANHSFSLPAGADVLSLLARGSLAYGDVRFESGDTVNGKVEVNVSVSYWSEDALKHTVVCRLGKSPKHGQEGPPHPGKGIPPLPPGRDRMPGDPHPPPLGRDHRRGPKPGLIHPHPHHPGAAKRNLKHEGIGIFTPRFGRNTLRFNITVRLPPLDASDANATHPVLVTDFANFKHTFEGALTVPGVHVKTSNAVVHADGLSVNRGSIKTSNGPIKGSYNTSHMLELTTSNAPIMVDVSMYSDAAPFVNHSSYRNLFQSRLTNLRLKTSNGAIDSHLSLYNTSDSTGAFSVHSRSSNAPSFLSLHAHPAFAPLTLISSTSNNRAGVSLHPSFVGQFMLRTSNAQATVSAAEGVADPSGAGLERHVRIGKVVGGLTEGRVWWGEEDEDEDEDEDTRERGARGVVQLTSSNGPIDLRLPDI